MFNLFVFNHPFSYHWQQTGRFCRGLPLAPAMTGNGWVTIPPYTYGDDWGMVNMDVNMAGANGCFNGIV